MGMQDKLLRSYIQGCNDTWDLVDAAIKEVPGIGPKTHTKMMEAIKRVAAKEVESVNNLSSGAKQKLYKAIDDIGFKGGDQSGKY